LVRQYSGDRYVKGFTCYNQFTTDENGCRQDGAVEKGLIGQKIIRKPSSIFNVIPGLTRNPSSSLENVDSESSSE